MSISGNTMATNDPDPTGNNLLLRGLAVLRCFGVERRALGSSDIARLTGLPQPTVWRICKTLESQGYLELEQDGTRYRAGAAVLTLGYAALEGLDIAALAKPALQDIANRVRGASGLSVKQRHAMLLVQRCEAQGAHITYNMRTGDTLPMLTSASGWAHLVTLSPKKRGEFIDRLARDDPDAAKIATKPMKAAFKAFETTGYILNSGILFPGIVSIAVPFESRRRGGAYVISCSATSGAFGTRALHRSLGNVMIQIASELSEI
jgi:DNA-binding IclR family transcriptional regulator